jgi:hypothetical protein
MLLKMDNLLCPSLNVRYSTIKITYETIGGITNGENDGYDVHNIFYYSSG